LYFWTLSKPLLQTRNGLHPWNLPFFLTAILCQCYWQNNVQTSWSAQHNSPQVCKPGLWSLWLCGFKNVDFCVWKSLPTFEWGCDLQVSTLAGLMKRE
jgi:hypothetical protein